MPSIFRPPRYFQVEPLSEKKARAVIKSAFYFQSGPAAEREEASGGARWQKRIKLSGNHSEDQMVVICIGSSHENFPKLNDRTVPTRVQS